MRGFDLGAEDFVVLMQPLRARESREAVGKLKRRSSDVSAIRGAVAIGHANNASRCIAAVKQVQTDVERRIPRRARRVACVADDVRSEQAAEHRMNDAATGGSRRRGGGRRLDRSAESGIG